MAACLVCAVSASDGMRRAAIWRVDAPHLERLEISLLPSGRAYFMLRSVACDRWYHHAVTPQPEASFSLILELHVCCHDRSVRQVDSRDCVVAFIIGSVR